MEPIILIILCGVGIGWAFIDEKAELSLKLLMHNEELPWLYVTGNILMGGGDQILLAHARVLRKLGYPMIILSLQPIDRTHSMTPSLEGEKAIIINNHFVDHVLIPFISYLLAPLLIAKVVLNSTKSLFSSTKRKAALNDITESLVNTIGKAKGRLQAFIFRRRFDNFSHRNELRGVHVLHATACVELGPLPSNLKCRRLYTEILTPKFYKSWLPSLKPMLDTYTEVIVPAETIAKHLKEEFGVDNNFRVIPFVSDLRSVAGFQSPRSNSYCCGIIARLSDEKGHKFFVTALQKLKQHIPVIQAIFAGDGPARRDIERLAHDLGVADRIRFIGSFEPTELPKLMSDFDIIVLPSLVEGMPHVLVEAGAFGKPMIATSVGAIPEMIEDGVNGYVVSAGDIDALADRIATIMENEDLRKSMSEASFRIYQEKYNYDVVLQKISQLAMDAT